MSVQKNVFLKCGVEACVFVVMAMAMVLVVMTTAAYCIGLTHLGFSCPMAQVSQVYQAIELKRLAELVPFTNPSDLERIVVEMACSNNIQVGCSISLLHRLLHGHSCVIGNK